jgi:hypothetical protein
MYNVARYIIVFSEQSITLPIIRVDYVTLEYSTLHYIDYGTLDERRLQWIGVRFIRIPYGSLVVDGRRNVYFWFRVVVVRMRKFILRTVRGIGSNSNFGACLCFLMYRKI